MHNWTAEKLKQIRKAWGETQSEFSQRLGVSKRTIENWEQGFSSISGPAELILSDLEEEITTKAGSSSK